MTQPHLSRLLKFAVQNSTFFVKSRSISQEYAQLLHVRPFRDSNPCDFLVSKLGVQPKWGFGFLGQPYMLKKRVIPYGNRMFRLDDGLPYSLKEKRDQQSKTLYSLTKGSTILYHAAIRPFCGD